LEQKIKELEQEMNTKIEKREKIKEQTAVNLRKIAELIETENSAESVVAQTMTENNLSYIQPTSLNFDYKKQSVKDILGCIKVSRTKYDIYEKELRNHMVSDWNEIAESNIFSGIRVSKYKQFLDNFQQATEIDNKTRKSFESLEFMEGYNRCLKTFTCNGKNTSRKYGMYIALKTEKETIDVAYSMYTYTAEFLKISPARRISDVGQKEGIYRFITPTVKDVPIKEMNHESKTAYLEDLAQNWLMTKALTNFARHGTIQEVSFIDSADNTII